MINAISSLVKGPIGLFSIQRRSEIGNGVHGGRGQSLVEFALVAPLLSLILLGTLDLGRLYFDYVAVTNAARVGAEYAMNGAWDSSVTASTITQIVQTEASPYVTIAASDVTVTPAPPWSTGNTVTVDARAKFTAFTPLISSLWGGGPLTLRGTTITRFSSKY